MMNNNDSDRRVAYRFEPPAVWSPIVAVIHQGRRIKADQVADVSLYGMRLAFQLADCPAFEAGMEVITSIQAPGLDGCADITGRIVFCASNPIHRIVAIQFLAQPDLSDRITADFFSVFNRRQGRREDPTPGETIAALVLNARGEADGVIDLRVLNQSQSGIGFVVDQSTDAYLRDTDTGALGLELGINSGAVREARIRHRSDREDEIYYGCTLP
jgi:hypothetical protein